MKYLRIKKRKDFTKILQGGKRVYCGTLTVVYFPSDRIKMAVCVGKRYGKSVERNKIKRLLREAFRSFCPNIIPHSFLLMPKVSETYSYAAFRRDFEKILKREKLVEYEIN
ncbi:MAG: ribonuclease P protein component [Clostridia bacterium]|nr:ribonuclease P protein component [Clostridia bacterium]